MLLDGLVLLEKLLQRQGIQFLRWNDLKDACPQIDCGLRESFVSGNYSHFLPEDALRSMRPGSLYLFQDVFQCTYYFIPLSPRLQKDYAYRYCSAGPMLFPEDASAGLARLRRSLSADQLKILQEHYNRIPLFPSREQIQAQLCVLFSELEQAEPQVAALSSPDFPAQDFSLSAGQTLSDSSLALSALEERYRLENEMLEAVTAGNTKQALRLHYAFSQHRITSRGPDAVRNQKNLLFVLNTLLRKAVQQGAVHPFYIDSYSRRFAIEIENASAGQLETMAARMIRKYCLLIHNYSMRGYSSTVQLCLSMMEIHYQEPLSLKSLAQSCAVSAPYLSALFRRETGSTVTESLHRLRIRHALTLLNATSLSIQEIALACGFPDANYFSRVFGRMQGQSPREYRRKTRQSGNAFP